MELDCDTRKALHDCLVGDGGFERGGYMVTTNTGAISTVRMSAQDQPVLLGNLREYRVKNSPVGSFTRDRKMITQPHKRGDTSPTTELNGNPSNKLN
jgi:hypothetical protein